MGGGNAERAVDSHQIVIHEVQGECRIVIFPFFAESTFQPRHASQGQLPLPQIGMGLSGKKLTARSFTHSASSCTLRWYLSSGP